MSTFLPQWRGTINKHKLSEALASLSLSLSAEELDKLWLKYDPAGRGELSRSQFMAQVGVQLSSGDQTTSNGGVTSRPATGTGPEEQAEQHTVLKQLMEKMAEKASSLLHALQVTDVSQSGLVTPEQLCSVLQSSGVPLTPEQSHHLLSLHGLSPTAPVDYRSLLSKLLTSANGSLTNSLFTSPSTRLHSPRKGRACVSTADAETRIVCHLYSSFLKLLAEFRSTDPTGKGLVTRDRFLSVLQPLLPASALPVLNRLADKIQTRQEMIPYPKFLAMFEHITPQEQDAPAPVVAANVQDARVEEVTSALSQLASSAPHQLQMVLEDQDASNTGRLTVEAFQQLLFRLGLPVSPELAGKVWPLLLKNKDGTVDHSELIRHFGRHHSSQLDSATPKSRKARRGSTAGTEQLTAALASQRAVLEAFLSQQDVHQSGYVPVSVFQQALVHFCPVRLSQEWLHWITSQYTDQFSSSVYYRGLLEHLQEAPPTYIMGNNLTRLLAQQPASPLPPLSCPSVLAAHPQHGLPGARAVLQKQLLKQWRSFRRALLHFDPSCTGRVPAVLFQAVLERHGVHLTQEQTCGLMESLDPQHTGIVNYTSFVSLLTD